MKIYWSGDSKNIIGAKVRALRLEKKWSQHDLATKVQLLGCECSDLTILRIEKGDRFVPDYEDGYEYSATFLLKTLGGIGSN